VSDRPRLLVGPPFARRYVDELTREELIEEMYRAYEQQEKYLAEIKRRGESMQKTMAAVAGGFK
jgi:hypothetical protein